MKAVKIIIPIILAILLTLVAVVLWNIFAPLRSHQVVLRIKPGDNAATIAQALKDKRIIRNQELFVILAKLRKSDRQLKAGTYSFGGHLNLIDTIKLLEDGNTEAIRITIVPGFSLYRSLRRIDASGLASYDSLLTRAQDPIFIKQLTGMNITSLEGFMLPETYIFDIRSPVDSLLSIPVREFFKVLKKHDINPQQIPNFYDKLILASIVEKESAHADEREIIAGVYLNRLRIGMRLQSCPTVDYLLEPYGIKRKVLTDSDLSIPSPYNTYLHDGLPPTPICNPSLQAIQAVINPKPNNYLYFVSNREGRNDFSATYQEHLRKKRIYESRE